MWTMRLIIHEEFTDIRSPEIFEQRYVYSSMESLLVSGAQKFPMEDAFTSLLVSEVPKFHMEDVFIHP
jgi:hypothetical protein